MGISEKKKQSLWHNILSTLMELAQKTLRGIEMGSITQQEAQWERSRTLIFKGKAGNGDKKLQRNVG